MLAYLLKYIQTASASSTTVTIQRDESLIPVFLDMSGILSAKAVRKKGWYFAYN